MIGTFDEQGRWVGTCPKCGTDHDGAGPPDTIVGESACLRAQARQLGAPWAEFVNRSVDRMGLRIAGLWDRALRRWWNDPR